MSGRIATTVSLQYAYLIKYAVPERLANLVCDAKRSALEWTLCDSMVSSFFFFFFSTIEIRNATKTDCSCLGLFSPFASLYAIVGLRWSDGIY